MSGAVSRDAHTERPGREEEEEKRTVENKDTFSPSEQGIGYSRLRFTVCDPLPEAFIQLEYKNCIAAYS